MLVKERLYLFGRSFSIFCDNKALVHILNNPNSNLPPRLERMILHIQGYNFILQMFEANKTFPILLVDT